MSHVSLKVALHTLPGNQAGQMLLRAKQGAGRGLGQNHTDDVYALPSGAMIKIRTYGGGNQEIILEQTQEAFGVRQSKIAVGGMRRSERDHDAREILGDAHLHVSKKRTLYKITPDNSVRLYHDRFDDGQSYLEWQMDDQGRPSMDVAKELKTFVLAQGFHDHDLIYDSYADLFLSSLFNEKSAYTKAYAAIPQALRNKILKQPVCSFEEREKIFSKGEKGDFAILIRGGKAHVPQDGVSLGAGQLVGEFASLEQGVRVCDVVAQSGLKGHVVRGNLLEELMTAVPANAQKYLDWRRAQARRAISGP